MNNTLEINDQGMAVLDLATLEETGEFGNIKGELPRSRPIEHYKFIQGCLKTFEHFNVVSKLEPILAHGKSIHVHRDKGLSVDHSYPLDRYLIQRFVTSIQFTDPDDEDMSMALAISFNEKGLAVAFGPKVWACANQMIFGENLLKTYGPNKMEWKKILDHLRLWAREYNEHRNKDYKMIHTLKNTELPRDCVDNLYGKLFKEAVLTNFGASDAGILNQSQCAEFVRASVSSEYEVPLDREITAWDLMQMGTSVIKPEKADMASILDVQSGFTKFIYDEYCAN
jgi:hypothetical protein